MGDANSIVVLDGSQSHHPVLRRFMPLPIKTAKDVLAILGDNGGHLATGPDIQQAVTLIGDDALEAGKYYYFKAAPAFNFRENLVQLLLKAGINNPSKTVLDTIELRYSTQLITCSNEDTAFQLYSHVKELPGASTALHFFAQHQLRFNGPFFPTLQTPNLLTACHVASGAQVVIKLLRGRVDPGSSTEPGGPEALAWKAVTVGMPSTVPIVEGKLLTLELTSSHGSTGHGPGVYAVLQMPQYTTCVALQPRLLDDVILRGAQRVEEALRWIHKKGFVHMDVKGANVFVDNNGQWLLGDFDAAVPVNHAIYTTTDVFTPEKLKGKLARFEYDWYMLAAMVVCELNKPDAWKEVLMEGGFTPPKKLAAAIKRVEHQELRKWLDVVFERAQGTTMSSTEGGGSMS